MDISGDLLRYGKKDNSPTAHRAKLIVRNHIMNAIGADQVRVFDAYAGEGNMYRGVWQNAAFYCGCDKQFFPDERLAFVAENERVLRCIDLSRFNVFDLDAYGSPWAQLYIIASRRPVVAGELLGLAITEGTGLKMNMGGVSKALGKLARISLHMPGMGSNRELVLNRALSSLCRIMQCTIEARWQANGSKGSRVAYIGLLLRGQG